MPWGALSCVDSHRLAVRCRRRIYSESFVEDAARLERASGALSALKPDSLPLAARCRRHPFSFLVFSTLGNAWNAFSLFLRDAYLFLRPAFVWLSPVWNLQRFLVFSTHPREIQIFSSTHAALADAFSVQENLMITSRIFVCEVLSES